ncbi:dTDP-4-dehydrorhamnose reductase [Undibacterium rugosum]|uniref:dTDP-4-dehydrorhamnose reductase n=1 Tax=Undibacterium rugosum TaxID=2762291 RepID=UPI001B8306EE|nr:dTDP-4-dehydrorhamnose reductase [Undibacterium rugosum]MBR7778674.1 dTDP-4-dehydrorhamnose reductase [Undibacterium rugosum]
MKILLTGVSGQLGAALLHLLAGEHEVIAADRQMLDLSQPASIENAIDQIRPDLIINPAAYTAVDKAETDTETAFAVNVLAPQAMARAAKRLQIGLIHYSTDYVFDGSLGTDQPQTGLPAYTETYVCNPVNQYGKTKYEGELAIQESQCQHLIFRTSWVYSLHGKNFLLTMLRLANERDHLRIVNDQFGAPTSALSIAQVTHQIVRQLAAAPDKAAWWQQFQGLYNLTNTGYTSWFGFTTAIVQQAGLRGLLNKAAPVLEGIPASDYPTPAKRPVNSRLDTQKIQQAFSVSIPDWQNALAECLDQQHPFASS